MNELSGRRARVHRVDFVFETLDLGGRNAQCAGAAPAALGRAQIGAEIEQIVLDMTEHRVGFGVDMKSGDADRGVGLVDSAVGGYPQRMLRHARTVAERGFALVAAARVDPGQPHHRPEA